MKLLSGLFAILMFISAPLALAQEELVVGYYGFEPDIVTNTQSLDAADLAAVRMRIQVMLTDERNLPIIEYHEPLLVATIIRTASNFSEEILDTASGKEQMKRMMLQRLQKVLKKETGNVIIQDVIFSFLIADPL